MNETIGFVILHYNAIKETIDCVNSIIFNIDTEKYYIIIVDNKSPNGTGKKLKCMYSASDRIKVILNNENLGFACGNNVGYKYACYKLKCDFICVLNNDTLMIQDNFFEVIRKEYDKSRFGVLGPRIILKDGSDNQLYYKFPDLSFFEDEMMIQKKVLWQMRWRLNYIVVAVKLLRNYFYKLLGKKIKGRYEKYQSVSLTNKRREDVVLHGCCIIFSKEYFVSFQEAFNPNTFLYKEEELLYLRCRRKHLTIVYNPDLKIKHLEDAATDTILRKKRAKIMFQLDNQIRSLKVLIDTMKKNEE